MTKSWSLAVLLIVGCGSSTAAKDAGAAKDSGVVETASDGAGDPGGGAGGTGGGSGGVGGDGAGQGGGGGAVAGTSGTAGSAGSSGGGDGGIDGDGGGEDDAPSACPAVPNGARMSWIDDGVRKCVRNVTARVRTNGLDVFANLQDGIVCIGCSIELRAPAMSGTFFCAGDVPDAGATFASFFYDNGSGDLAPVTMESCTVTITSDAVTVGAFVKGTFSAVLRLSKGGSRVISDGFFDAYAL